MKTVNRYLAVVSLALVVGQTPNPKSQTDQFTLAPIPASAHHRHQSAPHLRNANGTSQNWSGYAIESNFKAPLNGAVSDVKGTWTVPEVSSSSSASRSNARLPNSRVVSTANIRGFTG